MERYYNLETLLKLKGFRIDDVEFVTGPTSAATPRF
jgi:hypothetical protein